MQHPTEHKLSGRLHAALQHHLIKKAVLLQPNNYFFHKNTKTWKVWPFNRATWCVCNKEEQLSPLADQAYDCSQAQRASWRLGFSLILKRKKKSHFLSDNTKIHSWYAWTATLQLGHARMHAHTQARTRTHAQRSHTNLYVRTPVCGRRRLMEEEKGGFPSRYCSLV